jgi:putative DNA primase/helicase
MQWLLGFHGLALTGDVSVQLFPIYAGSRGKTTFLQVVEYLMGSYYKAISAATLLEHNSRGDGPRSDLADLKGIRLAVAVEPESGARLSVGLVKQLTGGDTITCRRLYGQPFSYRPTAKFILLCNHKPRIPQMDSGIARRLRVVPFELDLPLDRQDPVLIDKLLSEGPGILTALVRACVGWYRTGRGAGALPPCRSIEEATNDYKIAEDQIARFLAEKCQFGKGRLARGGDLCRAYAAWCELIGERPASARTLSERLVEKGFPRKHTEAGAIYIGLSIKRLTADGN